MSEYSWVPARIIQSVKAGLDAGFVKYKDLEAMEALAASENPEREGTEAGFNTAAPVQRSAGRTAYRL